MKIIEKKTEGNKTRKQQKQRKFGKKKIMVTRYNNKKVKLQNNCNKKVVKIEKQKRMKQANNNNKNFGNKKIMVTRYENKKVKLQNIVRRNW